MMFGKHLTDRKNGCESTGSTPFADGIMSILAGVFQLALEALKIHLNETVRDIAK